MYINTGKPKNMRFDVSIQGVDYKQLQGSVKFRLEGVEYGFPVDILKDHMSVDVPPLDEVIKKGLIDGETVECQLDVFGEGFYMKPWTGQFELKREALIEARMVYSEDPPPVSVKAKKVTLKEDVEETPIVEDKEVSVKEDITDGNETAQMIKLLEKLVSKRLSIPEGTTLLPEEIADPEDNPPKDDAPPEEPTPDAPPKDTPDAPDGEIDDLDVDKGVMGKRGKKSIVIEPAKDKNDKVEEQVKNKLKIMDSLVEKFLERANATNKSPAEKKVLEQRFKKRMKEKLKEKLQNKKKAKTKTESVKTTKKTYIPKQVGDVITESDVKRLFESVGMTKKSSQQRLIEVAKKMGSEDAGEIYHAVKRLILPDKTPSSYEDFVKVSSSKQ